MNRDHHVPPKYLASAPRIPQSLRMQQATPAPTERGSPPRGQPKQEDDNADGNIPDDDYPEPPKNVDSAPFYVLSTLFDKLQNERKPEKRRKLLDSWFNVCIKPRRRV